MNYGSAAAFRTALERRLVNRSRETGTSLVRLRKSVVFDRLLARLTTVASDRWMLKGALALDYRLGPGTRTTKDVDIGRRDDEAAATADLIKAQAADLGDFFVLEIQRTGRLDQMLEGSAVRYHVDCALAGRAFEAITLDVALGDPVLGEPELLRGPDLLEFAGIAPAEVRAISLAQHLAEKVHAYVRTYGSQRIQSTRVKDLVDMVLIAKSAPMDAAELRSSLERTFQLRGVRELPDRLEPPPTDWRIPFRKLAEEVGLDPEMAAGHARAGHMLDPVLSGAVVRGEWDPASTSWH